MLNLQLPLVIIGAYLLDLLIGDPPGKYHPVGLIGVLIDRLTSASFYFFNSPVALKFAGAIMALVVVGITYVVSVLFVILGWWAELLLVYFTLSIKSLFLHLEQVMIPLLSGDIEASRMAIGKIVGRDVHDLCESEISRAGIEVTAESFCDGIMAPLFFAAIGGAPLAMSYKAVNTLDSMVGYKHFPYSDLGFFSAKLDDVLNYIPARLCALIFLFIGRIKGFNYIKAFNSWRLDASKHPSPNAGQSESVMAGLLEVRLGGVNYYDGEKSFRPYLGAKENTPKVAHIKSAINLTRKAGWLALVFSALLALIINVIAGF